MSFFSLPACRPHTITSTSRSKTYAYWPSPPHPFAEKEDGVRGCQGGQGPSAKVSVVSTAVPSAALRTTHSDDRVGGDHSCESGRRRDLRGFPTSHRRTRAGRAPGSPRRSDTQYRGPAPGPQ